MPGLTARRRESAQRGRDIAPAEAVDLDLDVGRVGAADCGEVGHVGFGAGGCRQLRGCLGGDWVGDGLLYCSEEARWGGGEGWRGGEGEEGEGEGGGEHVAARVWVVLCCRI